jgi:flagellar protein FliJ
MKPFSLDSVLKYRVQLEKIAKNRLYEAEKKRAEVHLQLQQKEAIFRTLIADLAGLQSQGMEVIEMIRYEERISLLKNQVDNLRTTLAEKNKKVLRERENTLLKTKERKVMEKLKERQNLAWQQYLNKKEAAMLDEIAVFFHER